MSVLEAERVRYIPKRHMLHSYRNQNLPWWKALAELIDNAFDHGATRVAVTCTKGVVEVKDDGTGIKSIVQALTLGDHAPSATTKLGMYGVGLKDAWLSAGDKIEVLTVHKGISSRLTLDITQLDNDWYGPAPISEPTHETSGTTIRLHLRKQRNMPGQDVWQTLAWAFTPALESGKQIVRGMGAGKKKQPLAAVSLPAMTERVTEEFEVNGKSVAIDIGITSEGAKTDRGPFWIQYGHRIITGSSIGAKGYSTLRVAGRIVLGKGWAVTKNKDDLAELSDDLVDAIHERIKPLLEKAEKLTQDIESDALKSELENMFNSALKEAKKEARNSGNKTSVGTVLATNDRSPRRRAAKIHIDQEGSVEGEAAAQTKRRGIAFGWCYLEDAEALGKYDSLGKRVDLNIGHPFVARIKQDANSPALYSVAVAIYSEYLCNHEKDGSKTLFEIRDFGQCYGLIMKGLRFQDGNRK